MPSIASNSTDSALRDILRAAVTKGGELVSGQVIENLRVFERQSDRSPTQSERGVMVDGKFYALKLPDDVRAGDSIDVKVVDGHGSVELLFLAKSQEARVEKASGDVEILASLLKALNMNRQSAELLRGLLSAWGERGNSSLPTPLPDFLSNLFRGAGLIDGDQFSRPEVVRNFLSRSLPEDIRKIVDGALASRSNGSPGERALETTRSVLRELRALNILPRSSEHGELPSSSRESSPASGELLRQIAPAFEKVVASVRDSGVRAEGTVVAEYRRFKALVSSQGDAAKSVEEQIKVLLGEGNAVSPVVSLLLMLERLQEQTKDDSSIIGKLLHAFARDLRKEIEEALQEQESGEALKRALGEGLRKLYEASGLKPLFERIMLPESPAFAEHIPDNVRGSLRLIEAQMLSILHDPDFDEHKIDGSTEKGKAFMAAFQRMYRAAEDILNVRDAVPGEGGSQIETAVRDLREVLRNVLIGRDSENAAPGLLREVFQRFLQTVAGRNDSNIGPEIEHASHPLRDDGRARLVVEKLTREIGMLLIDLNSASEGDAIGSLRQGLQHLSPAFREELRRSAIVDGGEFKNLRQLLKQLAIELPAAGTDIENDLLEGAYHLAQELDQLDSGKTEKLATLKELARPLASHIQRYLDSRQPEGIEERALHAIDSDTLQRVRSAVAAQEALQRIMPMMKASGDPLFMIFPFIVGNMVHNAEVRFQEGSRLSGESPGRGDSSSEEFFSRLNISFTFARLGGVRINAAFRPGEILLNIGFSRAAAANFVEGRISMLRQRLVAMGFPQTQILVSVLDPALAPSLANGSALERLLSSSHAVAS